MAKMDSRPASSGQRIYEDIVPAHELIRGEGLDADTITIHIAGFKRADLKVQIDQHGKLMVTGERPVGENKWVRFRKYFQTPKDYNQTGIRAKFENERISITLPKIVAQNKLEHEEPEPGDKDSKRSSASDGEADSKADSHEAESTEQPADQQRLSMRLSAIKHKALEYGPYMAPGKQYVVHLLF